MNGNRTYKISKPITTLDELRAIIPEGESIPLSWDEDWTLFYRNIFGNVVYMSAHGQGDFRGDGKFFLYRNRIEPQLPITERSWSYGDNYEKVWGADYICPNCGEYIEPYDTDIWRQWRQWILHTVRKRYCDGCGIPLRWY